MLIRCDKCGLMLSPVGHCENMGCVVNQIPDGKRHRQEKVEAFEVRLVNRIRYFRKDCDTGVGDTLERILAKFGGNQFKWLMDRLGVNCGCEDRKQYLNRVFPYAPKLHHEEAN